MMKHILLFALYSVSLSPTASAAVEERFLRAHRPIPGQYIVILDSSLPAGEVPGLAASLAERHGGKLRRVMTSAANGFSVEMTEQQARALSRNPKVLVVEENGILEIAASVPTGEWHLDRLDQAGMNGFYTSCETGEGVYVYVVDTGVAKDHSEFQTAFGSKVLDGVSFADDWHPHPSNPGAGDVGTNPCGGFTGPEPSPLADNYINRTYNGGHGTSVASLIAGNTLGVSPGAKIVPVKIASCPPTTSSQNITIHTEHVCWGLDWIVSPSNPYRNLGRAVVNISFYTPISDPLISSFEHVVGGVVYGGSCGRPVCGPGWGVTVVASANNQDADACGFSPSRMGYGNPNYPRHVITVGGTRANDIRWDCEHSPDNCTPFDPGSNFGACVDVYAPAHNINSASIAGSTAIRTRATSRSGTSFSAPIVSGLAAQVLQFDSWAGPSQVWNYLSTWATLLPNSGDPHDHPQDPSPGSLPNVGSLKFAQTRPCAN